MPKKLDNKCTILVNSCDLYEDVWDPFFTLFKKYWPDCKFPIVLNTETKSYSFNGLKIKCLNLKKGKNVSIQWGERIIDCLERINSKYVLFFLDDYFLYDYVDTSRIIKSIDYMEKNENIVYFNYFRWPKRGNYMDWLQYDGYTRIQSKSYYVCNCQIALWRRDKLISYLRKTDSPWDFEQYGYKRKHSKNDELYSLDFFQDMIFYYNPFVFGISRSKWQVKTKDLFEKENIIVDFNKRGFFDFQDCFKKKKIFRKYDIKSILYNFFHKVKKNFLLIIDRGNK